MKKTRIYMGLPSTGDRCDLQTYVLREMEEKYKDKIELVYPRVCAQRIFHDCARSAIVEEFLESGCDILWFIDSDVAPPVDALDLVTEYGDIWDCAGLPYPVFMSPTPGAPQAAVICVYRHDGAGLKASRVPKEGISFVDGLATGCLFIKRAVFDDLERPWFKFSYNETTRAMEVGEDLDFVTRVAASGRRFLTDFSKICSHFKRVNLASVVNAATHYAQTYVDQMHIEYRERIRELAEEIERLRKNQDSAIIDRAKKKLLKDFGRKTNSGLVLP